MLPGTETHEKKAGLAYWAQRVLEECDKASVGFAADPVHDLRVAIRRCRSMADGFLSVDPDPAWKQMKRLGKPLFSSLGDLRDTQVMMEWVTKFGERGDSVAAGLMDALTKKEAELKKSAQESLAKFDRKHWLSLNSHLSKRTGMVPLEGLVFQHVALERWMDAKQLHRHALKNRSGVAYHQLRVGIKRFRYTVENFLPERHAKWSRDLRDLQDALGEVHDFDVLKAIIKSHLEMPAEDRLRWQQRIAEERQKRLNFYRSRMLGRSSLWNAWRSELPEGAVLEEAAMEKLHTWAAFLDPDINHTSLVTNVALRVFDNLSQCKTLTLSQDDRKLLEAAAVLHEIGMYKSKDVSGGGHQKRGSRMVCKLKPPLGWTDEEMQCVAAMVRHQRGAIPTEDDAAFAGIAANRRAQVMALIGILRLAKAFDAAHEHLVTGVTVETKDDRILVVANGLQEFSPTAERVSRARYLLESIAGLPIFVRGVPVKRTAPPRRARSRHAMAPATD